MLLRWLKSGMNQRTGSISFGCVALQIIRLQGFCQRFSAFLWWYIDTTHFEGTMNLMFEGEILFVFCVNLTLFLTSGWITTWKRVSYVRLGSSKPNSHTFRWRLLPRDLRVSAPTYYHRQKNHPIPCNHLDIGALRLPTLARNQGGDWMMQSWGRQPQRTDV